MSDIAPNRLDVRIGARTLEHHGRNPIPLQKTCSGESMVPVDEHVVFADDDRWPPFADLGERSHMSLVQTSVAKRRTRSNLVDP